MSDGLVDFSGDVNVRGKLTCKESVAPDNSVGNDAIKEVLLAENIQHQFPLRYAQSDGSDVVADTVILHVFRSAGSLVSVEAVAESVPAGGDKQVTIDIQKSSGGGSWSTVLTSVITIDSGETNKVPVTGTLASASFADGDIMRLVAAVSGSTGTQAQGLCVTAFVKELPT